MTDQVDPFRELAAKVDEHGLGNGAAPAVERVDELVVTRAGEEPDGPRPQVLVDGLLDQGDLLVLGAGRAVGKSWWGMGLAQMLGDGRGRFMGAFQVRQQARVLYCHGELDPWGGYERWRKLSQGQPLPPELRETFTPWRVRVSRRHIQTTPMIRDEVLEAILDQRLERALDASAADVLILDPWAVFYAGRENSNDEVEAALGQLRRLQLERGLTVVILHHFGKGMAESVREPEDLWRGASRLADWAATRVTLAPLYTPKQAEDQGLDRHQARRYARAHFLRRRYQAPADMAIRWDVETGQWEGFQSTMLDQVSGGRGGLAVTDLLAQLPADGWPSVTKAAAALGVSQATAKRTLEAALAQGFVEEWKGPRNSLGYRRRQPTSDLPATSQPDLSPPPRTVPPERSETAADLA